MKTENLNDLKNLEIVELTKEEQRQIMGGNGSNILENDIYGIDFNFAENLVKKPLGTHTSTTSDNAANYM